MNPAGVVALALTASAIIAEPSRDVSYLVPPDVFPLFDKGYLAEIVKSEEILVYGRDGARLFAKTFQPPFGFAGIRSFAVDTDGLFAVSLTYRDAQRTLRGAIYFLDSSGKEVRRVLTGAYLPEHLTFSAGHNLWALGVERTPDERDASDYYLLRRYTREGQETGRFLPRGLFPGWRHPGQSYNRRHLMPAGDRLGALYPASDSGYAWIEVDLQGNLIGRWDLGRRHGVAFTTAGGLYTIDRGGGSGTSLLLKFDRESSSWKPDRQLLEKNDRRYGPLGYVMGGDGNSVVVAVYPGKRLLWFDVEP